MSNKKTAARIATPTLSKTSWLRRLEKLFADENVERILDAPCGKGQFALHFARLGFRKAALDNSPRELEFLARELEPEQRQSMQVVCDDIYACNRLFPDKSFDAVLNIQLVDVAFVEIFSRLLRPGGLLFIKTYGNRGGNFLQLPKAGEYRDALREDFELIRYEEAKAGPADVDSVTAIIIAKRLSTTHGPS